MKVMIEPVAWLCEGNVGGINNKIQKSVTFTESGRDYRANMGWKITPLYDRPRQTEPVLWILKSKEGDTMEFRDPITAKSCIRPGSGDKVYALVEVA
jgi:hypothetical protein